MPDNELLMVCETDPQADLIAILSELIGRQYAEQYKDDAKAPDIEALRSHNTTRANHQSAAMHQLCRIMLQNAVIEDGITIKQLREKAGSMTHMRDIIMLAATQAEIVYHHAQKRFPPDMQRRIWEYKQEGNIDQRRKTALKQLDVPYFDIYDHQRFVQWWVDQAIGQGTSGYAA